MPKTRQNKSKFKVVMDTNIVVSAKLTKNSKSPAKEFILRWLNKEFILLYSSETRIEYAKKLNEKAIIERDILIFLADLVRLGQRIEIIRTYLSYYPADPDDIIFLLCAHNGQATHLVSYDHHLLDLEEKFKFKIKKPVPFLKELRMKLNKIKTHSF